MLVRGFQALLSMALLGACEKHEVAVEFANGDCHLTRWERREIQEIADSTARDVRAVLPGLPKPINLEMRCGKEVIPETGETAEAVPPATIVWTADPDRGILSVARTQLRATLFHELHHLARAVSTPTNSLIDSVVTEGMATAFERDFAQTHPPWGEAPPEVMDWTRELLAQPETVRRDHWLIRHPDGRRWIGMRVGTYLVDRAAKASGLSAADLVSTSTKEVLRLAHVQGQDRLLSPHDPRDGDVRSAD